MRLIYCDPTERHFQKEAEVGDTLCIRLGGEMVAVTITKITEPVRKKRPNGSVTLFLHDKGIEQDFSPEVLWAYWDGKETQRYPGMALADINTKNEIHIGDVLQVRTPSGKKKVVLTDVRTHGLVPLARGLSLNEKTGYLVDEWFDARFQMNADLCEDFVVRGVPADVCVNLWNRAVSICSPKDRMFHVLCTVCGEYTESGSVMLALGVVMSLVRARHLDQDMTDEEKEAVFFIHVSEECLIENNPLQDILLKESDEDCICVAVNLTRNMIEAKRNKDKEEAAEGYVFTMPEGYLVQQN